jgi:predicted permease
MVLPATAYASPETIADFQRRALERLEALPGVASASLSYAMPFFGLAETRKYVVAGRETPQPGREPIALINGVTPHYFETVGTRLLSGRAFNASDTVASPKVFVVNQAMASGLFGDESPIGRRIAQAGGASPEWGEIVGVVADVQSVDPARPTVTYQLYLPMAQEPRPLCEIGVRTSGTAAASLAADVRGAIAGLDPDLPVRKLQSATTAIERANYQEGVLGSVLSALATLGLGLACLGIYGVIARTVAQRTGEFGIRLALGAQAGDITRLVISSGTKLALLGSALGLVGAFGVTRLILSAYPGIHASSVPSLIGATLLLVAVVQIASYLPARQASRISPTESLRVE